MIYVNPAGEERVFRIDNWPLKDRGAQPMRIPILTPSRTQGVQGADTQPLEVPGGDLPGDVAGRRGRDRRAPS
jgi:hypothetical protein